MKDNQFVAIRPNANPADFADVYLTVKTEGREWLAEPAYLSKSNVVVPNGAPMEVIRPYDDRALMVFSNHLAAAEYILLDDERVKVAERAELEAEMGEAKPLPVNDNANDESQTVPDHVKLDMAIAHREWLVKAVAEIRKAGGRIRAYDLRMALGIDDGKARRLAYALGELGYGEIGLYGTITLFKRYMGPEFEDLYNVAS